MIIWNNKYCFFRKTLNQPPLMDWISIGLLIPKIFPLLKITLL